MELVFAKWPVDNVSKLHIDNFTVQDRSAGFNIIEFKMFIDVVSNSAQQLTFKKPPFVSFGLVSKKNIHNCQKRLLKFPFPPYICVLDFLHSVKTTFQFSSVTQSCSTLCDPMNRSTPGLPVPHQLPESTQTCVHWVGDAIQPSHPLSSPLFLPSVFPSIRVFSNESALLIGSPEYWSFSFNISPSNEHPGLISFRMDWLDLLAVQGTLKSLLQHHSSKASTLQRSVFFTVQLSHPYMTTGKTIALTRRTFAGKIMSLLFNMPSRLIMTFLPRSKGLLISWLQSLSAVILEPQK